MKSNIQKGFSVIEVLLVVAIIIVISFMGWKYYESLQNNNLKTDETTQATIPEVKATDDLQKSETYLLNSDIDSLLNTDEIDAALNE